MKGAIILLLTFGVILLTPFCSPAEASERRVALVVGNGRYMHVPMLKNPSNDATAVGAALERLGFDVEVGLDLTHTRTIEYFRRFGNRLAGADVGLFYYAGHGLQVSGVNYLAPVDARLEQERDLMYEVVRLENVLKEMEGVHRLKLLILDACRNNPLAENLARTMGRGRSSEVGRGLAPMSAATGTLIAFATKGGTTALDGEGRHSPFTQALLDHIETPGLEVGLLFRKVRRQVMDATAHRQVPWEYGALLDEFYFSARYGIDVPWNSIEEPDVEPGVPEKPWWDVNLPSHPADEITQLLFEAESRLESFDLSTPAHDIVLQIFQNVLSLDPGNPQALSGLRKIAALHAKEAEALILQEDWISAARHLNLAEQATPGSSILRNLRKILEDRRIRHEAREQARLEDLGKRQQAEEHQRFENYMAEMESALRRYDRRAAEASLNHAKAISADQSIRRWTDLHGEGTARSRITFTLPPAQGLTVAIDGRAYRLDSSNTVEVPFRKQVSLQIQTAETIWDPVQQAEVPRWRALSRTIDLEPWQAFKVRALLSEWQPGAETTRDVPCEKMQVVTEKGRNFGFIYKPAQRSWVADPESTIAKLVDNHRIPPSEARQMVGRHCSKPDSNIPITTTSSGNWKKSDFQISGL